MAVRTVSVSGFRVTVQVPARVAGVARSARRLARRARDRVRSPAGPESSPGSGPGDDGGVPRFLAPPPIRVVGRNPALAVDFVRQRQAVRAGGASPPAPGAGVEGADDKTPDDNSPDDTTPEEVARLVAGQPWYHTIELPFGITTPGAYDHRPLRDRYGLPENLAGKRVLDVGTADGFWAFELERRGAEVTSIDIEDISLLDFPAALRRETTEAERADPLGEGFALAHRLRKSQVRRIPGTVYDLDPDRLGTFDLVHSGDLLVHLRDPPRALEQMRAVTAGEALLAEVFDPDLNSARTGEAGLVRYLGGWELSAWWLPGLDALVQMVIDAGFSDVDVLTTYNLPYRNARSGPWRAVIRARP